VVVLKRTNAQETTLRQTRLVGAAVTAALMAGLAACPAEPDDGFGKARPVTNTGMVHKPAPVEAPPPDFNSAVAITPTFDKGTGELVVVLKIKPGFHAYAPGEEVGKPVALSVDGSGGWAVDGAVQIPAGTKKDLGELGVSMTLEGDVSLRAKLVPGAGAISGVVEAQVCTDKACDRPRKHPFSIPSA
jgi:hypothetical protein